MFKDYGQLRDLLQKAQDLQGKMAQLQNELAQKTVEGSAGGGMVTATVNGKQEVMSLTIDPELIASQDKQMLQDLVVAAINQALEQSRTMVQQEMGKMTGLSGVTFPGTF